MHHAGAGSGESKDRMLQCRGASMTQCLRRYNGRLRTDSMRVFLTAGLAARVPLCLARRRKAQAREHRAYLRGLWSGPPA